ncbi:MAG: alpha/beta hydrolase [Ruminococcaceae bacterium]|nr:alpha/beta hydrolase [Oscillospiraceae bacterium]
MILNIVLITAAVLVIWFFSSLLFFYLACSQYRVPDKSTACGGHDVPERAVKALREAQIWLDQQNPEQIYIKSHDGLSLYGELIEQPSAKGNVIFFHGYHSSCRRDIVIQCKEAFAAGYNVLLATHRGHGKSEGRYITFGAKEKLDVRAWSEYITKRFEHLSIALMGLSMGGSSVMFASALDLPPSVKCIVNDCGFSKPSSISAHTLFFKRFILPYPSVSFMDIWARLLAKFSFYSDSSYRSLKKNTRPLLIIHGERDRFVPTNMSRRNALIKPELTELLTVSNARHAQAVYFNTDGYIKNFIGFLDKNM